MSLPEIGPCAYPTVARCLLLWAVVRLQPQMATAPAVSTATLTYEAALQERRQLYRAVFFGLTQRSTCMAARSVPARRGVARNLTLDHDADEILQELTPSRKSKGKFISSLLLAEQARREERARMRQAVIEALAEPVGVSDA